MPSCRGASGRGISQGRGSSSRQPVQQTDLPHPEKEWAVVLKRSGRMLFSQISLVYLSSAQAPSVQPPKGEAARLQVTIDRNPVLSLQLCKDQKPSIWHLSPTG